MLLREKAYKASTELLEHLPPRTTLLQRINEHAEELYGWTSLIRPEHSSQYGQSIFLDANCSYVYILVDGLVRVGHLDLVKDTECTDAILGTGSHLQVIGLSSLSDRFPELSVEKAKEMQYMQLDPTARLLRINARHMTAIIEGEQQRVRSNKLSPEQTLTHALLMQHQWQVYANQVRAASYVSLRGEQVASFFGGELLLQTTPVPYGSKDLEKITKADIAKELRALQKEEAIVQQPDNRYIITKPERFAPYTTTILSRCGPPPASSFLVTKLHQDPGEGIR